MLFDDLNERGPAVRIENRQGDPRKINHIRPLASGAKRGDVIGHFTGGGIFPPIRKDTIPLFLINQVKTRTISGQTLDGAGINPGIGNEIGNASGISVIAKGRDIADLPVARIGGIAEMPGGIKGIAGNPHFPVAVTAARHFDHAFANGDKPFCTHWPSSWRMAASAPSVSNITRRLITALRQDASSQSCRGIHPGRPASRS